MTNEYFTDQDFDILMDLLMPFDWAFPEIQVYLDRLCFHLSMEMDETCKIQDWDEFRREAINQRGKRAAQEIPDKQYFFQLFIALCAVLRKVPLAFPQYQIHADRVVYETGRALEPKSKFFQQSFESFHLANLMQYGLVRRVVNTKARGRG